MRQRWTWLPVAASLCVCVNHADLVVEAFQAGVVNCSSVFNITHGCTAHEKPPTPYCGDIWKLNYDSARLSPEVEQCMSEIADSKWAGNLYISFGYWCPDSLRGVPPLLKAIDVFNGRRAAKRATPMKLKPVCVSNNFDSALPYGHRIDCSCNEDVLSGMLEKTMHRRVVPAIAMQHVSAAAFKDIPSMWDAPMAVFCERETRNKYGFVGDVFGEFGRGLGACGKIARPQTTGTEAVFLCDATVRGCAHYHSPIHSGRGAPPPPPRPGPPAIPNCVDKFDQKYGQGYCSHRKSSCSHDGLALNCLKTCGRCTALSAAKTPTRSATRKPTSGVTSPEATPECFDKLDRMYGAGHCSSRQPACAVSQSFSRQCLKTCNRCRIPTRKPVGAAECVDKLDRLYGAGHCSSRKSACAASHSFSIQCVKTCGGCTSTSTSTSRPTTARTNAPTNAPTPQPTANPSSGGPTLSPTLSPATQSPTLNPSTASPTGVNVDKLLLHCDFSSMTLKLHEATVRCPGLETGVAPTNCSMTCAEHYLAFWETCGTLLQAVGVKTVQYGNLANTCTDTIFPRGSCDSTCNERSLRCRTHAIKRACCDNSTCTMVGRLPVPSTCSYECSLVLPVFLQECNHVLAGGSAWASDTAATNPLAQVNKTCLKRDHQKLLDILYDLDEAQGCPLDLSNVQMLNRGTHQRRLRQASPLVSGDSETCKWDRFNRHVDAMNAACCPALPGTSTECADGLPDKCNARCAIKFNALHTQCTDTLRHVIGGSRMEQFSAFEHKCLQFDVATVLDVARLCMVRNGNGSRSM